jgi:predicted Zn-dependent peptidase
MARAEQLQSYNHYVGNPDYLTQDLDRMRKSSPEKVRDAAAQYLKREHRLEVLTLPAKRTSKSANQKEGK